MGFISLHITPNTPIIFDKPMHITRATIVNGYGFTHRKLFAKTIKAPEVKDVLICKVNQDHEDACHLDLKFDKKDIFNYMLYSTSGDWDIVGNIIE